MTDAAPAKHPLIGFLEQALAFTRDVPAKAEVHDYLRKGFEGVAVALFAHHPELMPKAAEKAPEDKPEAAPVG